MPKRDDHDDVVQILVSGGAQTSRAIHAAWDLATATGGNQEGTLANAIDDAKSAGPETLELFLSLPWFSGKFQGALTEFVHTSSMFSLLLKVFESFSTARVL